MRPRYHRSAKKIKLYNATIDIFIERLRRIRALNSDPSFFGMDSEVLKKFSYHKIELPSSK